MKYIYSVLLSSLPIFGLAQGKVNVFLDASPSINKFDKALTLSGASANIDFKTYKNLYVGAAIHNWAYELNSYYYGNDAIQSNTSALIDIRGIFRANKNIVSYPFVQFGVPISSRYEIPQYSYNAGFGIAFKRNHQVGIQANFKLSGVNYDEGNKINFFISLGLMF